MGKDKKYNYEDLGTLLEQQRRIERKINQRKIPCSHTNSKGMFKLNFDIPGKPTYGKCKKCGTRIDLDPIDINALDSAIETVHNAINQCKVFSEDPEREKETIIKLGELDYQLEEVRELYKRTLNAYTKGNKKKKNKHKNNDDNAFGGYGRDSMHFLR